MRLGQHYIVPIITFFLLNATYSTCIPTCSLPILLIWSHPGPIAPHHRCSHRSRSSRVHSFPPVVYWKPGDRTCPLWYHVDVSGAPM